MKSLRLVAVLLMVTVMTGAALAGSQTSSGSLQMQVCFCLWTPFGPVCFGCGSGSGSSGGNSGGSGGGNPGVGNLPSLPPFPGIDPGDFGQGQKGGVKLRGISPTISPNGFVTVPQGAQFPVTISQIDMLNYTIVRLAEWLPTGQWTLYDLSGYHSNGSVTVNFYAGLQGLHFIIAWVDNNHDGQVEFGELTIPWLTVLVQ